MKPNEGRARVVIEEISPTIDGGRYPAKRVIGDRVKVTAAIFSDLKKTNTLVVVEHDMGFVRLIADVVIVMHMGSLLAQGSIRDIEQNDRVREVYLGENEL